MIRVAIVGCGKIADQHVEAVRRLETSHVVAVCDCEPLMANQLAERFAVGGCFSDLEKMLSVAAPDVVHITTPPQSHCELAQRCLSAGAHVYLEKPFTVTAGEAESLIETAQRLGLRLTVGHNYQFTLEMLEMRRLVEEGYLGGAPVHLESHWSYDLGDTSYVGPLLATPSHWVRRLPGQLFHNIVSHGIARLAEFLDDEVIDVFAMGHQSAQLRSIGGGDMLDELRVLVRDKRGTTATFCFSTQIKPGLNRFQIYGPVNSLTVDAASGSLLKHRGGGYKSYLTFLVPPVKNARDHLLNAGRNFGNLVRQRLYHDSGMTELISRFHRSIGGGDPPPVPYREILLTARIMDTVFAQIKENGHAKSMEAIAIA